MRINNTYLSGLTVSWLDAPASQARPRRAARPGEADPEVSSHIPSAEVVHWTTLAAGETEVRSELLKTILERIAQRFYLTAASAEQTAEAILQTED